MIASRIYLPPGVLLRLLGPLLTLLNLISAQSLPTSTDGFCGSLSSTNATCLSSTFGSCCSAKGYCGATAEYCGAGCQLAFGSCSVDSDLISSDGSCGGDAGRICVGSVFGDCCSSNGFCGNGTTYCGTGCQGEFGSCDGTSTSGGGGSSTSASASASTSTAPSASTRVQAQPNSIPTTSTAGFKGGMAALGVVLALTIAGILLFIFWWRPRQRRRRGPPAVPLQSESKSKLDLDPTSGGIVQEMPEHHSVQELPASEYGKGDRYHELPAVAKRMDLNEKGRLVDERAAAGYEGAYRGN